MNIFIVSIPFIGYLLPFVHYMLINEYIECRYTANCGYMNEKCRSNNQDIEKQPILSVRHYY